MKINAAFCYALTVSTVAMLAGCGGSQPPIGAPYISSGAREALPHHHKFDYTGAKQLFRVPVGVTSIAVVALGAAGGATGSYYGTEGGAGGRVHAVIPVYRGEKLYVFVGGIGFVKSDTGYSGFNGGGDAGPDWFGFGGGGASDIRQRGARLSDRILVAGGGGGDGGFSFGGAGGAGGGLVGGPGGSEPSGADGGGGGSQSGGGTGGAGGGGTGYLHGTPVSQGNLATAGRVGTAASGQVLTSAAQVVEEAEVITAAVAEEEAMGTSLQALGVAADHRTSSRAPRACECGKVGKPLLATGL
jgi:hypothetical protein